MTPLQRLISDFELAFRLRHQESLDAYEVKAKATIKAMGETHRRGIGQKTRFAIARLQKG